MSDEAIAYTVNGEEMEIDDEVTGGELKQEVSDAPDEEVLIHYDPENPAVLYEIRRTAVVRETVPPEHALATVSPLAKSTVVQQSDADQRPGLPAWVVIDGGLVRIGRHTTPEQLQQQLGMGGDLELVWHDEDGDVAGVCRDTVYGSVPPTAVVEQELAFVPRGEVREWVE